MGGKSSPPPAPDFTGAAQATAAGNLAAAQQATAANRVNFNTPFGSLNYTQGGTQNFNPSIGPRSPSGADDGGGGGGGAFNPTSGGGMPGDPNRWTANVSLSPDQQRLLDAQTQTQFGLAGMQSNALSAVQQAQASPFSLSGMPNAPTAYQPGQQASTYNPVGGPSAYDPTKDTGQAFQLMMQRMQPQMQQQEDATRTRLANQGLGVGSEAANNELNQLGRNQNDQRIAAALQSFQLGMQQQGQTFGQQTQNIQTGMAQQGQQFGQQFNNSNQAQNQQQQQFAQADAIRKQAIQEQQLARSQPLNELNALRTGSQLTMPTFNTVPQQQTTAGPNYLTAANDQYTGAINAFNGGQAQSQGLNAGLFGLGGAALSSIGTWGPMVMAAMA